VRKLVGISQKIKRAWLDALLDRLVKTTDEAELRTFLDKRLKEERPGTESRAKTSGIILRIWSGIPPERISLRDRAVALLPRISGQERIWLHWGMTTLAYPFFRDTAEVVGRLLALQDDFTTAQVQGRMLTTWGDRATSKEAAQKLITTLVDWEVLRATKGHFLQARKIDASTPDLQLWLLEALLGASTAEEIEARQLLRLPESFPFTIEVGVADFRRYDAFNIHRQGLDMDMVALRKAKLEPKPKPVKKPQKDKAPKAAHATLFDMEAANAAFGKGKADTTPVISVAVPLVDKQYDDVNERGRVEDTIKIIVPDGPFAAPSVECVEQFLDGHYFGCIALTHGVLEAVIRHVWQIVLRKAPHNEGSFNKNLEALHKKKIISDEWKIRLDQMWSARHLFYQLRPSVDSDQRKLEEMARNNLNLLNELERAFFPLAQ
jgi:hypothetical protein